MSAINTKRVRLSAVVVAGLLSVACAAAVPGGGTVPLSYTGGVTADRTAVPYGSEPEQLADIYLGDGDHGTIVYVHGGSWTFGTRKTVPSLLLYLVTEGWDVVSIDYRLSGSAVFPAAVQDASTAVSWIRGEGDSLGLETGRVVLSGWSAGANIASLAAFAANDEGFPGGTPAAVDGVLAIAGAYDMTTLGLDSLESPGGWLHSVLDGRLLASPESWLDADDPATLAIHGVEDPSIPVSQVRSFSERATEVGFAPQLTVVEVADPQLDPACRGHQSWCGVPLGTVDAFMESLDPS